MVFVVDDPGTQTSTVSECDEENNFQDSGFWLNRGPQVDIGPSPEVSMPDATAVLAATATDDGLPLGADLSIAWYWLTDSGDFIQTIFSDPHSLRPTVTFPRAGQYRLMLQVSDSRLAAQRSLTVVVHPANEAPVVSAGADQVLALPADTLTLAGSASDDGRPAGSSLEVVWTAVSGPGPVTFANPASPATTATLTTVGTYVLRLTASDGALTTSDDVEVELEPANQAPVVDAGRDARVLALVVPLTGSVTDDGKPRGGTLVSNWTAVSGPGPVAFADASAPTTVATCSAPGTYVLRLSASDGELTATDEVTIVANPGNEPPFVEAGPSQAVTSRRTVLEGTVRDDGLPADSTVAILWSQVSGPAPAALATPAASESAVLFDAEGAYVFRLQASDGDLASEDLVAVEVRFVNLAPTVEAGADAEITLPASSLLLQGSVSDDGLPLGGMLTQSWALVSGPAGVVIDQPQATETLVHFVEPGIYVLRLRGSDGTLRCDDTVTIVVRGTPPSGAAPVASLSVPSSGARLTIPTEVVGTATSDTLAGWQLQRRLRGDSEWVRFASGTEAVSDGPLGILDPTQLLNGIHEVRLQVTDSSGRIARATVVVVVRDQVKVGHFTVSFVDLEVPVAGVPLRVTRTYDSRDKTRGDFGVGWRLDVSNVRVQPAATLGLAWYGTASAGAFPTYCIQPTAPPIVTLTFPDGRVEEFEMRLSKECQPMAPIPATQVSFVRAGATLGRLELIGSADVEIVGSWPGPMQLFGSEYSLLDPAAYRYTAPDGRIFVVDRATGLRSLTDTAGNVLTVTFAGITASHPSVPGSSLGISFTRDTEGRITRVTDPSNHVLEYEYDAAGDLVSVTDREENETTFTYLEDPAHHLLEIHDPLG
ncbi:MAG: hypothetical protein JW775_06870, partial [Candidatus Aminicenantes bacterium]|nr:hypothetical protein [Candidatus Aminicenantes bacterium]